MRNAISIVQWFQAETIYVYAEMHESSTSHELHDLIAFMHDRGGAVTFRQVVRESQRFRGKSDATESALKKLEALGVCKSFYPPIGSDGGRPAKSYKLIPDISLRFLNTSNVANEREVAASA